MYQDVGKHCSVDGFESPYGCLTELVNQSILCKPTEVERLLRARFAITDDETIQSHDLTAAIIEHVIEETKSMYRSEKVQHVNTGNTPSNVVRHGIKTVGEEYNDALEEVLRDEVSELRDVMDYMQEKHKRVSNQVNTPERTTGELRIQEKMSEREGENTIDSRFEAVRLINPFLKGRTIKLRRDLHCANELKQYGAETVFTHRKDADEVDVRIVNDEKDVVLDEFIDSEDVMRKTMIKKKVRAVKETNLPVVSIDELAFSELNELGFEFPIDTFVYNSEATSDPIAFVPWYGGMTCTCRNNTVTVENDVKPNSNIWKHELCIHELIALLQYANDSFTFEGKEHLPQRSKRLVHQLDYEKALSILNNEVFDN